MLHDSPLDRAYTMFGLPAGSSHATIVRQYRRLVKRWHPDRFANDPPRYAEATRRMQDINAAFALLRDRDSAAMQDDAPEPAPMDFGIREQHVGRRLTDEEIAAIASSIGEPGILQFIVRYFVWMGGLGAGFWLLTMGGRARGGPPRTIDLLVGSLVLAAVLVSVVRAIRQRWDN